MTPVSESPASYLYRADVLEHLARHGVAPKVTTAPRFLRDFLNELYRYELRRLRDRVLRHEIPYSALSAHVIVLRGCYPLLSLPLEQWIAAVPATTPGD